MVTYSTGSSSHASFSSNDMKCYRNCDPHWLCIVDINSMRMGNNSGANAEKLLGQGLWMYHRLDQEHLTGLVCFHGFLFLKISYSLFSTFLIVLFFYFFLLCVIILFICQRWEFLSVNVGWTLPYINPSLRYCKQNIACVNMWEKHNGRVVRCIT